jgi:hypothetical protein
VPRRAVAYGPALSFEAQERADPSVCMSGEGHADGDRKLLISDSTLSLRGLRPPFQPSFCASLYVG